MRGGGGRGKNKKRRRLAEKEGFLSTNLSTRLVKKLVFVLFGPRDSIYELNRVGEHDETRARRISSARISPLSFLSYPVFLAIFLLLIPPFFFSFLIESDLVLQIPDPRIEAFLARRLAGVSAALGRTIDLEIGNGIRLRFQNALSNAPERN